MRIKTRDSEVKITKADVKKIFKDKIVSKRLTVYVVMRSVTGLMGAVIAEICSTKAKAEDYIKKHKNPLHVFTVNTYKVK